MNMFILRLMKEFLIDELQVKDFSSSGAIKNSQKLIEIFINFFTVLYTDMLGVKLESLDNLEEGEKRLIEEPLLEKTIAKDIPVLEAISNACVPSS